VVEVLGGSRESHDVHRFIHHSLSIKLTRALPPIQQTKSKVQAGAVTGYNYRLQLRAIATG
jgi:hypothetical protein